MAGRWLLKRSLKADFDRRHGLASVPARLGLVAALRLAAGCHFGMLVMLAILPWVYEPLGAVYGCGVGLVAVLLVYEHALVRPDDLTRVNVAFFHVNSIVSIGLLVIGMADLLW